MPDKRTTWEDASEKQKYFFQRSSGSIGPAIEIKPIVEPLEPKQEIPKKQRPRTSVNSTEMGLRKKRSVDLKYMKLHKKAISMTKFNFPEKNEAKVVKH